MANDMSAIETIRRGIDRVDGKQGLRRIYNGAKRAVMFVWRWFGMLDSSLIISMYFVGMGIVLLILNTRHLDQPTVLNVWIENADFRILIAVGFIALGWLIAYTKSLILLTIGSVIAMVYGLTAALGVYNDMFSFRGLTVLAQNVPFALAILRTSYVELQRVEDKRLYERTLAGVKAYSEVVHGRSAANPAGE